MKRFTREQARKQLNRLLFEGGRLFEGICKQHVLPVCTIDPVFEPLDLKRINIHCKYVIRANAFDVNLKKTDFQKRMNIEELVYQSYYVGYGTELMC